MKSEMQIALGEESDVIQVVFENDASQKWRSGGERLGAEGSGNAV